MPVSNKTEIWDESYGGLAPAQVCVKTEAATVGEAMTDLLAMDGQNGCTVRKIDRGVQVDGPTWKATVWREDLLEAVRTRKAVNVSDEAAQLARRIREIDAGLTER